jgi:hypothetical protein
MSSDPSSESNLRSLFETALREYEKQSGTNLLNNCLIIKLHSCDSVDAISAVLQEQAQAFNQFRGGDGKLIRWLNRTVHVLHTLSSSSVLGSGIGLVRYKPAFDLPFPALSNVFDLDAAISTRKCHLRRN